MTGAKLNRMEEGFLLNSLTLSIASAFNDENASEDELMGVCILVATICEKLGILADMDRIGQAAQERGAEGVLQVLATIRMECEQDG